MLNRHKLWFTFLPLILINNFISSPAQATSVDAITLESISAVSNTVLTGENIVMQLQVAVPTGYTWDPVTGTDGSQLPLTILVCLSSNWNGTRCSSGSQSITANSETSSNLISSVGVKTFQLKKILVNGAYIVYKIVIPQPSAFDDVHTYNRNFLNVIDMWGDPNGILVPTFLNADFNVVEPTPTPTPTPSATVSETPTPTPSPTPTVSLEPLPSSNSDSSPGLIRIISSIIEPIAIQASGRILKKSPSVKGDLTWQKAKELNISNKKWTIKKNKKASGGSFMLSSISESKILIATQGDAFTLRYMTGKNMGRIRVNIDGKKLAEFNTSSLTTKVKAKSWIGIGPGKHKIEIIPILDPGQSVGIDAYQLARGV